ncbi:hypothetical protein HYH02_001477 [Chlamydomonas schloesseri]|uniref:Transaldolase n=1 Tax=Chlamydomonas schloesseri TaxID=2026947 RepID=A0A835WWH2_9CHLO|nr:hypothetical protein HYH02_001477 [Chlamydomonas schloesseri]|eukprot:KAG2454458.1 hypothetical protein HYH02_001477 [Chlamydomonas schloesseri]
MQPLPTSNSGKPDNQQQLQQQLQQTSALYSMSMLDPAHRRGPEKTEPSSWTQLRLFLDSASVTNWELWMSTRLFYGITTNPTILEKDGQRCTLTNLQRLCHLGEDLGVKEMQFQAWGDSAQSMVSVALDLFGMNPELVVVKLPCTLEGFQAAALLRESSVRITMTGIYTASQVLLAQSVGAEYAAPYLGRMNDAYGNNKGFHEVVEMQRILHAQKARTRLLVASVREPSVMASLAAEGCDTFTISPAVAGKLFAVSYTLDAVEAFEQSARRMGAYDQDEGATTSTLLHRHGANHSGP